MSAVVPAEATPAVTDQVPVPTKPRPATVTPLQDDRWPDRFATALLLASVFTLVITLVPPWHRYFAREWDVVSLVVMPSVPGFVYTALLLVMAVALRRRLRAAWWLLLIWWLALPQLGRLFFLVSGLATTSETVQLVLGLLLNTAVIIVLSRTRQQFSVRGCPAAWRWRS